MIAEVLKPSTSTPWTPSAPSPSCNSTKCNSGKRHANEKPKEWCKKWTAKWCPSHGSTMWRFALYSLQIIYRINPHKVQKLNWTSKPLVIRGVYTPCVCSDRLSLSLSVGWLSLECKKKYWVGGLFLQFFIGPQLVLKPPGSSRPTPRINRKLWRRTASREGTKNCNSLTVLWLNPRRQDASWSIKHSFGSQQYPKLGRNWGKTIRKSATLRMAWVDSPL